MPLIDELRGIHKGEEIHIIGTGPSLKFLPVADMLKDKITIGLNRAYLFGNWKYNLSIHPEIVASRRGIRWITKKKGTFQLPWQQYYLFRNNQSVTDFGLVEQPQSGHLYVGRGIHTAAIVLAAEMLAKRIYLYGIDCNCISKLVHHANEQHTQFYGLPSSVIYREYYENAVRLREVVYNKYKCQIISVFPFLGLGYHKEDFDHLMKLHGYTYPDSPPKEIKNYTRPAEKFL